MLVSKAARHGGRRRVAAWGLVPAIVWTVMRLTAFCDSCLRV